MRLTCTQENLRIALSTLERVVGKQSTLPILSNILLETEKGQLRLSATNLEIGVITSIGAKIESEGRVTVPAKLVINFVQNLALDQVVCIEQVGTQIVLESGNYKVKINGLDGKDFPIIPEKVSGDGFILDAQELHQGLQRVLFCVSPNQSRPELTGVLFGFREGCAFFAATDSFRLAEWKMIVKARGDTHVLESSQASLIIPAYTLQEVVRVIAHGAEEVNVALEENQIFFEIGSTRIVSRLINGKFPEYQAIIPKQFSTEIILNQVEFQRALKIATSFSSYSTNEVVFRFNSEDGWLEITSQSQGIGEQVARIQYEGTLSEPLQIVFNPRYILDGSANSLGSEIRLALNSPSTPVRMFSDDEKDRYMYIVMPIRK